MQHGSLDRILERKRTLIEKPKKLNKVCSLANSTVPINVNILVLTSVPWLWKMLTLREAT